ncbi:MAG TPA: bacteriohopanetetrol glucosamine biosynthesis glycosyltransferase HpnI [Steroidobacteraceae bacterium]|nr:bacteriohopanetetrol glucosamine biosynthesis glycosyltransferase HpnI [Steroidobacteraceae bacterium]
MNPAELPLNALGTAIAALGMGYAIAAALAVRIGRAPRAQPPAALPPVTVLKPLCGAEPTLYEHLRTFCEQRYPRWQIVFGVREPHDRALEAVERLRSEFPHLDLQVAVNSEQHGTSSKVSNLLNMLPLARHDYLVIADSDICVEHDYLERVITPLLDERVGLVTCPYRGRPRPGLWSLLGSMFINEWFMPSVRVAAALGSRAFAFGATIALRRDTLAGIGGFAVIANQLPDDYRLGQLTRRLGLRTVLSEVEVETSVHEGGFAELVRHELRWLRTIRTVRPLGYAVGGGITFGLPVAFLGCVLADGSVTAVTMVAITAAARLMINSAPRSARSLAAQLGLIVCNDLLGFLLWCWSFATRRVHWRDGLYQLARDGTIVPIPE